MKINLKTLLYNFFDTELKASAEYVLCGCLANDNFAYLASKYVKLLSKEIKYKPLKRTLTSIYTKTDMLISEFKNEADPKKKFDYMMYVRGVFSLLEGSVENSLLTKNIINQLRNDYGVEYIDKIAIFDRKYLSEDALNFFNKKECVDMTGLKNSTKSYLLLKKFQDITHKMYLELSNKTFKPFTDSIIKKQTFKNLSQTIPL